MVITSARPVNLNMGLGFRCPNPIAARRADARIDRRAGTTPGGEPPGDGLPADALMRAGRRLTGVTPGRHRTRWSCRGGRPRPPSGAGSGPPMPDGRRALPAPPCQRDPGSAGRDGLVGRTTRPPSGAGAVAPPYPGPVAEEQDARSLGQPRNTARSAWPHQPAVGGLCLVAGVTPAKPHPYADPQVPAPPPLTRGAGGGSISRAQAAIMRQHHIRSPLRTLCETMRDMDVAGRECSSGWTSTSPEDRACADDTRIRPSLPTIDYPDHGAAVILASHLGRPRVRWTPLLAKPIARYLSEQMGLPVDGFNQPAPSEKMAAGLQPGEVCSWRMPASIREEERRRLRGASPPGRHLRQRRLWGCPPRSRQHRGHRPTPARRRRLPHGEGARLPQPP